MRERKGTRPSADGQSGQSLLEFALVIPVILIGLLILVDFGRVVYAQNAITQNAAVAARYASMSSNYCDGCDTDLAVRTQARLVTALVPIPDGAITGPTGCSEPDGTYRCKDGNRVVVVVRIQVQVPLITPIISSIVGGAITVTARAEEVSH